MDLWQVAGQIRRTPAPAVESESDSEGDVDLTGLRVGPDTGCAQVTFGDRCGAIVHRGRATFGCLNSYSVGAL